MIRLRVILARERESQPVVRGSHLRRVWCDRTVRVCFGCDQSGDSIGDDEGRCVEKLIGRRRYSFPGIAQHMLGQCDEGSREGAREKISWPPERR